MKLTFGKFNGWELSDLAKAGERDYLRWGAENLKSPMWRKAFADALKSTEPPDVNLVRRAMYVRDPQLDPEEAEYLSREEAAEQAEDAVRRAKEQAIVTKYAAKLGLDEYKLRQLYHRYGLHNAFDFQPEYSEKNFSSHQKFLDFDAFIKEMWEVE